MLLTHAEAGEASASKWTETRWSEPEIPGLLTEILGLLGLSTLPSKVLRRNVRREVIFKVTYKIF